MRTTDWAPLYEEWIRFDNLMFCRLQNYSHATLFSYPTLSLHTSTEIPSLQLVSQFEHIWEHKGMSRRELVEFEVPSRSMTRTEICTHASVCITERLAVGTVQRKAEQKYDCHTYHGVWDSHASPFDTSIYDQQSHPQKRFPRHREKQKKKKQASKSGSQLPISTVIENKGKQN
jgi:hypothetical protein